MKLKALPLIISGVAAIASTQAMAAPTVYGKANVSIQHVNDGDEDNATVVNSNASRIGFKGSEKLSDSLKAIYKFEYEADVDGDGDVFKQRNIYAGLQGGFGTVAAGKHDTPFKMAQGKVDQFNDLSLGDIKNVLAGENRAKNMFWYASPKMGGLNFVTALTTSEKDDTSNTGLSAMVNFKQDGLYLALAVDQNIDSKIGVAKTKAKLDSVRLVGQFNAGDFGVGGIYQTSEPSADGADAEQTGLILSGYFKMDKTKLKLQYGMSEIESGSTTTEEITSITFGADHKLSKKTKVYGYYSMWEEDKSEKEKNTLGVGLEVKF